LKRFGRGAFFVFSAAVSGYALYLLFHCILQKDAAAIRAEAVDFHQKINFDPL